MNIDCMCWAMIFLTKSNKFVNVILSITNTNNRIIVVIIIIINNGNKNLNIFTYESNGCSITNYLEQNTMFLIMNAYIDILKQNLKKSFHFIFAFV